MQNLLPELGIGDPLHHQSVTMFPLFAKGLRAVDYILTEEATREGTLQITELSKSGEVGRLKAENRGSRRVLLLEGQILSGAKQDRVVNATVLVPAKSTVNIPVSCVEQGRWRWSSPSFTPEAEHVPPSLRAGLRRSVSRSLRSCGVHESDQAEVWSQVQLQGAKHSVASPTDALTSVIKGCGDAAGDAEASLPYVDGATGFVIVNGARLASLDCFDQPETCRVAWEHAIPGVALDVRTRRPEESRVTSEEVERFVDMIRGARWSAVKTVGEGQEHRSETILGFSASVLVLGDDLVHASAGV